MRNTFSRGIVAVGIFVAAVGGGLVHAAEPCTKSDAEILRMNDRRTTREVERRITSDESVAALAERVRVETSDGVVTLSGTVTSTEDRLELASLAESAPGVRHVEDRLEVLKPWHGPPSASPPR
jgi:hypothetical protein